MKILRSFIAGALLLTLAACGSIPSFDLSGPVTYNTIAGAQSAYGVALAAMNQYKRRPLCLTGTVSTPAKPCARRSLIVKMQAANGIAINSVRAAVNFVEENPKIDATNIIGAALDAVRALRSVLNEAGIAP